MKVLLALLLLFGVSALLTLGREVPPFMETHPAGHDRVEGITFPRTLIDAYGRRLSLHQPPRRIVSAMLATDEMLLALLPKERLAGVTSYATMEGLSNCVAEAQGIPQYPSVEPEKLLALQPDLVLVGRYSDPARYNQLVATGISTFRFGRYDSLHDIRASLLLLGQVVGAEARAARLAAQLDATAAAVRVRAAKLPRKLRVLHYNSGYTAGRDTLLHELLTLAGGRNLAAEAGLRGHVPLTLELALALDPEMIVMPAPIAYDPGSPLVDPRDALRGSATWQATTAVRTKRLYLLPSQHVECTSHHAVETAVDLIALLEQAAAR